MNTSRQKFSTDHADSVRITPGFSRALVSQYVCFSSPYRALAIIAFAMLSGIALVPSSAHAKFCASTSVTATSKPHTSRSLQAVPGSLIAWKREAAGLHDSRWNVWVRAEDKSIDCAQLTSGPNDGKWVCTRTARPCTGPIGNEKQTRQCKPEVTSYGARRDNRRAAETEARTGWLLAARNNHGNNFATWDTATRRAVECFRVDGKHQCIATARPCTAT